MRSGFWGCPALLLLEEIYLFNKGSNGINDWIIMSLTLLLIYKCFVLNYNFIHVKNFILKRDNRNYLWKIKICKWSAMRQRDKF